MDGMTVQQLPEYLKQHWPAIREQLLSGTYKPQPVRRVEIPKPDGGVRKLGIPTVLDRFIQQAVMQVLQGRWDRTFSDHSYGFRPGRSAHQAVAQAQQYIAEGYRWWWTWIWRNSSTGFRRNVRISFSSRRSPTLVSILAISLSCETRSKNFSRSKSTHQR